MKISYAIPVCNEHEELEELLNFLQQHRQEDDEIVILCDEGNTTQEVYDVINSFDMNHYYINENPLNKDFAQQKNYLNSKCTGDWIFLIDADEMPTYYLLRSIPELIQNNSDVEAYWIPRINTVTGLTQEHIDKWRWNVDERGWVNFPDYQMRLYKNDSNIKWIKPVHEQLTGFSKFANLPSQEEFCLLHPKHIKRQEKQNNFYQGL